MLFIKTIFFPEFLFSNKTMYLKNNICIHFEEVSFCKKSSFCQNAIQMQENSVQFNTF